MIKSLLSKAFNCYRAVYEYMRSRLLLKALLYTVPFAVLTLAIASAIGSLVGSDVAWLIVILPLAAAFSISNNVHSLSGPAECAFMLVLLAQTYVLTLLGFYVFEKLSRKRKDRADVE